MFLSKLPKTLFAIFIVFSLYILPSVISNTLFFARTNNARVYFQDTFDSHRTQAIFNNESVDVPQSVATLGDAIQSSSVLGDTTAVKRIDVDLTQQRLFAYEGNKLVYSFLISSGKWGRTPTGIFRIWSKFRYTKMEGGSKQLHTYYYLPNVPYTMFFYNEDVPKSRGFGIHGTYWHDNFGHPMSHGCINMKTEEVEKLFYWANPDLQGKTSMAATPENPGTIIIIFGNAPRE